MIAHTVKHMIVDRCLEIFETADIHAGDLRRTIVSSVQGEMPKDWIHDGEGKWMKSIQEGE